MTEFTFHTEDSAPEASKPWLTDSKKSFGMIPGLHAVMAEAPALLEAYKKVGDLFVNSSYDKDELTVIWQSVNVEHDCHYCVPAHTGVSKSMGVSDDIFGCTSQRNTAAKRTTGGATHIHPESGAQPWQHK